MSSLRRVAIASLVGAALLVLVFASGCSNSRDRVPNAQNVAPTVDAHIESLLASGLEQFTGDGPADLILASAVELVNGATLGGPLSAVSLAESILVGFFSQADDVGASHTYLPFGVADLRTLGKDEQFVIEVVTDLTELTEHNDIIDNGQIELDIRPLGEDSGLARIKFLRRKTYGGWDELTSANIPVENFLGLHTFAGKWANNRMELFIDGVLVAEKYAPARTRPTCGELIIGKECIGRIGTISLCPPDHDPLASFEAVAFGDTLVRGDINQDGSIDQLDFLLLRDRLALKVAAPDCPEASDVNDDGVVDGRDVVFLIQLVNHGGPIPPEPFLTPDVDRDEDGLTCTQVRGL